MSELKGMLELNIDRTRAYVIHKGRLPKDAAELYEWLNEFTEYLRAENALLYRMVKDYAAITPMAPILQVKP